eukprot:scaffold36913_cov19-Tisochrysis_lutea.AAC.1
MQFHAALHDAVSTLQHAWRACLGAWSLWMSLTICALPTRGKRQRVPAQRQPSRGVTCVLTMPVNGQAWSGGCLFALLRVMHPQQKLAQL